MEAPGSTRKHLEVLGRNPEEGKHWEALGSPWKHLEALGSNRKHLAVHGRNPKKEKHWEALGSTKKY